MSLRNSSPQYKIVSFLRNKIPSHGTHGTSHMHMYTQTHTFPDQRPDDPMASTQKKGKSFDLPQLELNYLLVFLSVSMPPTDRHTALLGYIQCHYIQILPEHSSPRCELFSSPVLRRKELLGQNRALSKSGGSSEHKAGSKQAQQLRSLHLFQCLAGTRESWWQSQQPGPVQWDPSKDTQQQHRFNPFRLLQ